MNYTLFAATYNCSDTANQTYGAGNYSTCDASASVGAPNTGFFSSVIDNGAATILLPLVAAIILSLVATFMVRRRKVSPPKQ